MVKSNIELRTTDEKVRLDELGVVAMLTVEQDAAEETPGVASNLPENIREKSFERNL